MNKPFDNKSPEVVAEIEKMFPGTLKAIAENKCPACKQPIGEFRNEISKSEYKISGLCQTCQDKIFGED